MQDLHGVFVVMTTPFLVDGSIDYTGAKKNIKKYIEAGVHGLLPLGATGEFAALSLEERKTFAAFVTEEVKGRVPVCIGAVSQNIGTTLEICQHAHEIQAAGVMVLPPPGLHLNQTEIYEFFKHISQNISLPVMIYNNPGSAGVDIAFDTLEKIAGLPHVACIKESTGDIKRLSLVREKLGHSLTLFCGWEDMAYESFVMGAQGWVCVLGNVAPVMSTRLFELVVKEKNLEKAWDLYTKLLPLLRYIESSGKLWQVVKYAQDCNGFTGGPCRLPRQPLTPEEQKEVKRILEENPLH